MNIKKLLGSVLLITLLAFSGSTFAKESIKGRITALKTSIVDAFGDSQISKAERDALLVEWGKLNKLYATYIKDKNLTQSEATILDSKIKKFDLNLFRKKYD